MGERGTEGSVPAALQLLRPSPLPSTCRFWLWTSSWSRVRQCPWSTGVSAHGFLILEPKTVSDGRSKEERGGRDPVPCPVASSLGDLLHFESRCSLRHREQPVGPHCAITSNAAVARETVFLKILLPGFGNVLCLFLFLLKLTRRDKVQK